MWWISSVSVNIFPCHSFPYNENKNCVFASYWNTWAKGPPAARATAFSLRSHRPILFLIVSSDILSHVARMSIGHFQRWALTDSWTSLKVNVYTCSDSAFQELNSRVQRSGEYGNHSSFLMEQRLAKNSLSISSLGGWGSVLLKDNAGWMELLLGQQFFPGADRPS